AFELPHAGAYMFGDEAGHVVRDRELELVLLGLLAQDRDAVLQVRLADVGDHPPLEPGDQPVLETRNLLGGPIRGEHHLLARLEQGVEGVEELVLGHFLAFEEMHVVHQEEVDVVAIAAPSTSSWWTTRSEGHTSELQSR